MPSQPKKKPSGIEMMPGFCSGNQAKSASGNQDVGRLETTGEKTTSRTADPLVDAYLWVKRPGESDGTCKGGPKAGQWWASYALALAKASK